ncbi:MAG: hypothetical protein QXX38_00125 [Candidatus Aenigmatarchaeota archaeon]
MIGLVVVSSNIEKQKEVGEKLKKLAISTFNKFSNIEFFDLVFNEEMAKNLVGRIKKDVCGLIVLVATGGTERTIRALAKLRKPMLILANPFNNSLASSLEAYSKIKEKYRVKLFYSDFNSDFLHEIKSFSEVCEVISKLKDCKIGVIGKPSKWPLSKRNKKLIRRLGPSLIQLKIRDFLKEIEKVNEIEANNLLKRLRLGKIKVSKKELIKAIKVYLALKGLASKYKLSAVSIKCFDIMNYNYTPCLGVSLCNDDNLIAGCEADLQSILTMIIVSFVSNQQCWMANPSRISFEKNTILIAHCTIATKMISDSSKIELITHMESGSGVAIRGPLKNKEITLVRLGGNLEKMLIATGKIVKSNMKEENVCRTQAEVKLKGKIERWIENSLGNHQVLVYGNIEKKLIDFCRFKNIEAIVI